MLAAPYALTRAQTKKGGKAPAERTTVKTASAQVENPAVLEALFNTAFTLPFERIRYPVVQEIQVGPLTLKIRKAAFDPWIGLPRFVYP